MRVRLCRSDVLGMSEAAAPVTKPLDSCRTQKFSSSSRPLRGRQRADLLPALAFGQSSSLVNSWCPQLGHAGRASASLVMRTT